MGSALHSIKEVASFISTLLILIILSVLFGYMFFSIVYVVPYINNPKFLIPIYIVIPFPIILTFLKGIVAYGWYTFLVIALSISGILLGIYGVGPYFKSFFKNPFGYRKNVFQEISELYALNIFFGMVVVYILFLIGYVPYTPPGLGKMSVWMQMLAFLHASFYEEVITRTIFLGIPVFLVYFFSGKKVSPLRILGGYGKITSVEAVFIIISAGIFATAHIPAWDVWKVVPTFVGGLVLGYLYIKYGIYASIMVHFMTDFISVPMAMYSGYQFLFGIILIVLAIAGAAFFVSYSIRAINFLRGKRGNEKERSSKEYPHKESFTPSWTNLVCPNCGGTVFQYVDKNTVRCVNCGTIIKIEDDKDKKELI